MRPEDWLPGAIDAIVTSSADGRRIVIGSVLALSRQLVELNAATWRAGDSEALRWADVLPADDASLELKARYAFAVLSDLARQAVEHQLPMKLDY